jgi:hypothetical protein
MQKYPDLAKEILQVRKVLHLAYMEHNTILCHQTFYWFHPTNSKKFI